MDARELIIARQTFWAQRHDIPLGGPLRHSPDPVQRERGRKCWVFELNDNLFEPLADDVRTAFQNADGAELHADRPGEGNMYALHSSSALACNLFHYWATRRNVAPIARALRLPSTGAACLAFEAKFEIDPARPVPPNVGCS